MPVEIPSPRHLHCQWIAETFCAAHIIVIHHYYELRRTCEYFWAHTSVPGCTVWQKKKKKRVPFENLFKGRMGRVETEIKRKKSRVRRNIRRYRHNNNAVRRSRGLLLLLLFFIIFRSTRVKSNQSLRNVYDEPRAVCNIIASLCRRVIDTSRSSPRKTFSCVWSGSPPVGLHHLRGDRRRHRRPASSWVSHRLCFCCCRENKNVRIIATE